MSATLIHESSHGQLLDATTLRIQRTLPGPLERVWPYLVDGELRRQWLAAGDLLPQAGADFELVWRNDELSASPDERPEGFPEVSRASCTVIEAHPPHLLRFLWPEVGDVSIELESVGERVLLTLTHRRIPNRGTSVMVGAGWHMHLDILVARALGTPAPSFWSGWAELRCDYEQRLPAITSPAPD